MEMSKDVLSVLGMLCISRTYRAEFFANPQGKAQSLVGRLRNDEIAQIEALAGKGDLPSGLTQSAFVQRMSAALDEVYMAATCPDPPCPFGDDKPAA